MGLAFARESIEVRGLQQQDQTAPLGGPLAMTGQKDDSVRNSRRSLGAVASGYH